MPALQTMTGLLLAPCTRPIDLQGLARTRRAAATPLFPSPSCAGPLQLTYSPAPQTFAAAKQKTLVQPMTGSQPHGMMLLNKNSVQSFVAVLLVFDMLCNMAGKDIHNRRLFSGLPGSPRLSDAIAGKERDTSCDS